MRTGGAEAVYRDNVELAKRAGYEVYTASCDDIEANHLILDDFNSYPRLLGAVKYVFNYKNYKALNKFLNSVRPNVVHLHNYLGRLSPSILLSLVQYRARADVKLVITEHNYAMCPNGGLYDFNRKMICEACINGYKCNVVLKNCDRRGLGHSLLKYLRSFLNLGLLDEFRIFDQIVCVSEFQRSKYLQMGKFQNKFITLLNPINKGFVTDEVAVENKENAILYFGRLSGEKNIALLILAFKKLKNIEKFNSLKLYIIGDGVELPLLLNISKGTKDIEFIKHLEVEKLKKVIKACKISVLPSLWYETFGLSVVESVLASTIPLASDIGALGQTARDFGGFTFASNDVNNLKEELEKLLDNYEKLYHDFLKRRKEVILEMQNYDYMRALGAVYEI